MPLRQIIFSGCLLFFGGCTSDTLTPAAYVQYIRNADNGYIQRQDQADIYIEAFYQPPEYATLMQLPVEDRSDSLIIKKEIRERSNFYQFLLSVGSNNAVPIDEILKNHSNNDRPFSKKQQQMLYNIQNNFALLIGKDSLPCIFYQAQPNGKIDNAYHFILAFEVDSVTMQRYATDNLTLIYQDSLWLHKRFDFNFNRNKINQSPRLKL